MTQSIQSNTGTFSSNLMVESSNTIEMSPRMRSRLDSIAKPPIRRNVSNPDGILNKMSSSYSWQYDYSELLSSSYDNNSSFSSSSQVASVLKSCEATTRSQSHNTYSGTDITPVSSPNKQQDTHVEEIKENSSEEDLSIPTIFSAPPSTLIAIVSRKLTKRRELVKETITTEEIYVRNLTLFVEVYAKEAWRMMNEVSLGNSSNGLPLNNPTTFSESEYKCLFGNIKQILGANTYLLEKLKNEVSSVGEGNEEFSAIGRVFQETAPCLKLYTDFVNNYDEAYELYQKLRKQKWFKSYVESCVGKPSSRSPSNSGLANDLATLLIIPIQRIPRYQMLLQNILEVTDESMDDYPRIQQAVKLITDIAHHCDKSKAASDTLSTFSYISTVLSKELGINNFIQSHRRFVASAQVNCSIICSRLNFVEAANSEAIKSAARGRRGTKEETSAFSTHGNYSAYLFSDVVVLLPETTGDKLLSKTLKRSESQHNILVLFLHFCSMVSKPSSHTFKIVSLVDNMKQTLLIRSPSDVEKKVHNHQVLFSKFKGLVYECIQNSQKAYKQRCNVVGHGTSLLDMAEKRQKLCDHRCSAQTELQIYQTTSLEMRRRIHKLNDEIVSHEHELEKLEQAIRTLKSSKERCLHLSYTLESNVNEQDAAIVGTTREISQLDKELLRFLNDEVECFQKVLKNDPELLDHGDQEYFENDVYKGKKLRRRGSLSSVISNSRYDGDYTAFCSSALFSNFEKHFGEPVVVFSSMVHYIVSSGMSSKECRLVITNSAVYLFNGLEGNVRCRIPVESIMSLAVSSGDDNFFAIQCSEPHDFLLSSIKKTEIIEILQWVAQPKYNSRKELSIQVASSVAFLPKSNGDIINATFESRESLDSEFLICRSSTNANHWIVTYNPNWADTAFLANKLLLQQSTTPRQKLIHMNRSMDQTKTSIQDVYRGKKMRRRCSIDRDYIGLYIPVNGYRNMKQISQLSDILIDNIQFCDSVTRYTRKLRRRRATLVITDSSLFLLDHRFSKCKTVISFVSIERVSVSSLSDNFLCIHTHNRSDELLWSERKTEICHILLQVLKLPAISVLDIPCALTFNKGERSFTGSFGPAVESSGSINSLQLITLNTFHVSVPQCLKSCIVLESMSVHIDGLPCPLELCSGNSESNTIPCLKLPLKKVFTFHAEIAYYALGNVKSCHVEQRLSSKRTVVTPIEDSPASEEQRYTIQLAKQTLTPPKLRTKKRIRTRILDDVGNEVGTFVFDVRFC